MSAASVGRRLAGSRVGGGRPGEGDWWWVSERWGSKHEHMFAAGYTKKDLKGLLFLDDNDSEAEAADCLKPINSPQWSATYQMHYVHFERHLLNKDNKDVFLENLYTYIRTNEVHTVVFDWDKVCWLGSDLLPAYCLPHSGYETLAL